MATATIGRGSRIVSPQEIAARKEAAARAELGRNGVKLEVTLDTQPNVPEQTKRVESIDVTVRTLRREEFRSAPDAKPMSQEDISNVEFLDTAEIEGLTTELANAAPKLFAQIREKLRGDWAGLLNESEIWTLTTMAMRKYQRTGLLPK